jgi:ribosomal protein S10
MQYERTAIERWIEIYHTSPLTRRPLKKEDLVPSGESQVRIDSRLRAMQAEIDAVKLFEDFIPDFRKEHRKIVCSERVNLLERETIPSFCYNDSVLREYICPITGAPIRHPVVDPITHRQYERAAIEKWIDLHHTSPSTVKSLLKEELLPSRDVKEFIDNQLREIQADIDLVDLEIAALAREEN